MAFKVGELMTPATVGGMAEQDADAVLLLYREDMEDPDALADLIVAKNRWGQLGAFKLRPELSKHRFRD